MLPGTLALVAPGDVHANRKTACTFRCMLLESRALQAALERFMECSLPDFCFRSELIEDRRSLSSFLRLHCALEGDQPRLERDYSAFSFMHELVARHSTANVPAPRDGNEDFAVRRTRRFLDEHYDQRISLQQLAKLMRLSAFHLNRSFRRKFGLPPHEYQLQVRILKAKSFLRLGRSISETAALVGFVDQSHFTRHFKRSVGVTPGKFLR
jgi:AraC-like DNA-binding protein